jgi:membrane protein implicated in regulation of membrane protease activity
MCVMTSTMPELGWTGRLWITVFIMLLVAGIVLYHRWMDRRLGRRRERSAARPKEGRRGDARPRLPGTET